MTFNLQYYRNNNTEEYICYSLVGVGVVFSLYTFYNHLLLRVTNQKVTTPSALQSWEDTTAHPSASLASPSFPRDR